MKRTAEFVLGLVGGIIGILMAIGAFLIGFIGFWADDANVAWVIVVMAFIFLIIQVVALILSCLVNRMDHKLFGGLMITCGILSFPFSIFFMFIPSVLYIIAGALGLRGPEVNAKPMEIDVN